MECSRVQTYYPIEEDEEEMLIAWDIEQEVSFKPVSGKGNYEKVKIFIQENV